MKIISELNYIDKSTWYPGEWKTEPDKIYWIDKKTGFDCLIIRNELGFLCGYVGINKNHPYFEKDYDEIRHIFSEDGLEYSDFCQENNKIYGICHPTTHEDKIWWFGFSCTKFKDIFSIRLLDDTSMKMYNKWGCTYKNINHIKKKVLSLAKELKEIKYLCQT